MGVSFQEQHRLKTTTEAAATAINTDDMDSKDGKWLTKELTLCLLSIKPLD